MRASGASEIPVAVADPPVDQSLGRGPAGGGFLNLRCNLVPVGGAGPGKRHLAAGIARAGVRGGARGCEETPTLRRHVNQLTTSALVPD